MKLDCGHNESEHESFTTGYGTDSNGKTFCYECAANMDKAQMRETGRIGLYLTHDSFNGEKPIAQYDNWRDGKVTNWPGSLSINARVKRGKHNMARYRYDAWFKFEGKAWHGVQYGYNTQLIYCKVIKSK